MAMIAAVMSTIAYAEIDTEHLFGFLTGTDIGEVGEKEVESETTSCVRVYAIAEFSLRGWGLGFLSQHFWGD
jgi:hypothetical protein